MINSRGMVVNLGVQRLLLRPNQHSYLRPIGLPVARIMWQAGVDLATVETVALAAMDDDDTRPRWERMPS